MITLNAQQQSMVDSGQKQIRWLFEIFASSQTNLMWESGVEWGGDAGWGTADGTTTNIYKNSTTGYTQDYALIVWESGVTWVDGLQWNRADDNYDFKVIATEFTGMDFRRGGSEYGVQAPSSLSFTLSNKNNALSASTFIDGTVLVTLVIDDGTNIGEISQWKFVTINCEPGYQKLFFTCEDFLQQFLYGYYPKTVLSSGVTQTNTYGETKEVCLPVPYGTCYIPLSPVLSGNNMYYLLGPADKTYTVTKISSPIGLSQSSTEYLAANYTFTQSNIAIGDSTFKVLEPIIVDTDNDRIADSIGLWSSGNTFYDIPTKFSRSDTSSTTNPADVIQSILEDFGVASGDIDINTFADAKLTYTSWGLGLEGGFYKKELKKNIIASILAQCNSTLRVGSKIELHPNVKASRKTINKANVLKSGESKESSFTRSIAPKIVEDSAYIGFIPDDTPQINYTNILITPTGTSAAISGEIFKMPFVHDNQKAQRSGEVYYQRKLWRDGFVSFMGKSSLLAIQPADVITISHADYGGAYEILVDSVHISKNLDISITGTKFKYKLEDWGDATPVSISVATNPINSTYFPIISGQVVADIVSIESQSTGRSRLILDSSVTPPLATFDLPSGRLQPNEHFTTDLGTNRRAFNEAYADNWNNVADFLYMDSVDDLGLIEAIKSSGIVDKKTGFELIDDNTIPKELLIKDEKGKILRDPMGKPWLSNRVMFSLLMGSIKQLHKKLKELNNG